jgi:SAM-dependent methyltransferase
MSKFSDYGGKNWEKFWHKLEQSGNIGIDFIINPYLYREIAKFLIHHSGSKVVDFGAGTNILAIQFMHGYQSVIPGLKSIPNIFKVRKNVNEFIGLEGSEQLVLKAKNYLKDLGYPSNIDIKHFEIKHSNKTPLGNSSITLAVSRNFLMHLEEKDFDYHISEAARILKNGGKYILAFLNPEYEQKKYLDLYPHKTPLKVNEKYSFAHGSHGEYGIFFHYWKDIGAYEKIFRKYFKISSKIECFPITENFKEQYPRYYQKDLPIAFVYILVKKK